MSGQTTAATSDDSLESVLQETRVSLLHQILASETGLLSLEELSYRNPDEETTAIREEISAMHERGIVEQREIPEVEREDGIPDTFFGVTQRGENLLARAGLLEERGIWEQLYQRMERTEEIERIEQKKRESFVEEHQSSAREIQWQIERTIAEVRDAATSASPLTTAPVWDDTRENTRRWSEFTSGTTVRNRHQPRFIVITANRSTEGVENRRLRRSDHRHESPRR